jgi:pilus assembly protein CpaC
MKKILVSIAILLFAASGASALDIGVGKGQIVKLSRPAAHVFIADPEIADIDVRSPNYIYVYGLKSGETSLHALDANSNPILQTDIVVTANYSNMNKIIKEVLPDSNIRFTSVEGGLVMQGEVNTPEDAQKAISIATAAGGNSTKLVNMLKVQGSDQVMLRVRVAEVSRTQLKNFGINLADILTNGTFGFGLITGRSVDGAFAGIARNGSNNLLKVTGTQGDNSLTGVIDVLENQGLVKVLAEPNLTAKSGESASFLAGGEFPIPIPQQNGVTTIEYKQFGVQLDFTPIVLSNNKISLKVAPNVSSLAPSTVTISNNNIPTLSIRKASTTVELGSGESFSIAGLMRNDVTNDISKFPWLGDVPVLGALFRSNNFQNNETELVIIITPYIVRGVKESDRLLTPTDGFEPPSDADRLLFGKMTDTKSPGREENEPQEGTIAKYKLYGNPGYMIGEQ